MQGHTNSSGFVAIPYAA